MSSSELSCSQTISPPTLVECPHGVRQLSMVTLDICRSSLPRVALGPVIYFARFMIFLRTQSPVISDLVVVVVAIFHNANALVIRPLIDTTQLARAAHSTGARQLATSTKTPRWFRPERLSGLREESWSLCRYP